MQGLFALADAVAQQGDLQAIGRVFRAEAVFFPGEGPIEAVRPLFEFASSGSRSQAVQVESESCAEKVLRGDCAAAPSNAAPGRDSSILCS